MAEISNKFLVFLLVVAILVTIVGTWYSIDRVNRLAGVTGYGTAGYVNVTITGKISINITQPYCGFGSGHVTEGYDYAILAPGSTGEPPCCELGDTKANWTNTTSYAPDCMVIKNVGNTNAKINVSSDKDAATMIGGSSPNVTVWFEDKTSDACIGGAGLIGYPGSEISTANITICNSLDTTNDEMYVGCYLKIPKDAIASAKTAEWTFTGTAAP
ncbi:MAG: hypothetical protein IB618_00020 [Candidatus Pacearchaeota archaeon]|nr:MAG: hypothetical protein IB618_00020 [Candidatus Pacearchaeota archaeon]